MLNTKRMATGLDIAIGEHVYGFAVSFDWLGEGEPGAQFYEIIDPDTFETINSGWTVPEPGGDGVVNLRDFDALAESWEQ